MTQRPDIRRALTAAAAVFFLDQASKDYLVPLIHDHYGTIALTPFFNLVMVWNRGVSFGLFSDMDARWLMIAATGALTLALLFWLWRARDITLALPLGMIVGGALGNIVDRLRYGAVADFLDFYIGIYHWPAFNLADASIVLGVGLLLWREWRSGKGDDSA